MNITYRDGYGYMTVSVDASGISFCGDFAYFSDGESDYTIPIADLMGVSHETL